mmetsp:Transcript_21975/g.70733  ORF Transcript_21975/g.70733 Transcript_21975/m.70733 type:complete len:260 (-) Transcript_21975:1546-2325(-)
MFCASQGAWALHDARQSLPPVSVLSSSPPRFCSCRGGGLRPSRSSVRPLRLRGRRSGCLPSWRRGRRRRCCRAGTWCWLGRPARALRPRPRPRLRRLGDATDGLRLHLGGKVGRRLHCGAVRILLHLARACGQLLGTLLSHLGVLLPRGRVCLRRAREQRVDGGGGAADGALERVDAVHEVALDGRLADALVAQLVLLRLHLVVLPHQFGQLVLGGHAALVDLQRGHATVHLGQILALHVLLAQRVAQRGLLLRNVGSH